MTGPPINLNRNIAENINRLRQINDNENITINDFLDLDNLIDNTRRRLAEDRERWSGDINFMLWNATGLLPNLDRIVRRMESEEILLCFVTETWLNPKHNIPAVCRNTSAVCSIMPQGYNRGKNGVSLIINPKMSRHPVLKDLEILAKDTLNGTFIYLQIGSVKILCVYYPPSCPTEINVWIEEIFLKCNINSGQDLIILGDFNARLTEWGDHESNSKGRVLFNFMENIGQQRYDTGGEPTFIKSMTRPQDGWSIIDHVFSNCEISDCRTARPFNSAAGHRPITGKFSVEADTRNEPPTYKRLKLEQLRETETKERWYHRLESVSGNLLTQLRISRRDFSISDSTPVTQSKIDVLEKQIIDSWLTAAKEVIGEKKAGKRIIRHEPLFSPNLEALETAIIWEQDEGRLRDLMKRAEKERTKLKKERFDEFTEKVGDAPASEMMKIISSMLCNRQKQQLALNSSPAALAEYRDHFAMMNRNTLASWHAIVEPILEQELNTNLEPISSHFEPFIIRSM